MRILHLDENHPLLVKELEKAGFQNTLAYTESKSEIERTLKDYNGLVVRSRFPIDASFLAKGTNLKFIARVGAGVENIDQEAAKELGIEIFAAPLGNANTVGEHALGMLLGLMNKLRLAHQSIQAGEWLRETHRGEELEGKTVGIIGYGNMGKSFAKKLLGFDVKEIIYYDIETKSSDDIARQVTLEELQAKAEILSLHTPQTPLTVGMIDATFLGKMQHPFWLINTARGSAVKTRDLVDTLKNGTVKGAALDVLEYEKSSFENLFATEISSDFSYLLAADNVLLSPHVAGWSIESHRKLAQIIAQQIILNYKEL
ncbi:MAG: NAD(P)-dependent oxidoreductase [Flavobacteriaceae bacterium]